MAQLDVELHGVAAQIDVAVLQAHLFVGEHRVARQEWRLLGLVQNAQFIDDQFDLAGRDVLVDGVGVAQLDGADGGDDELVAQRLGLLVNGRVAFLAEDHLRDARAVAHIDEDQVAEVAAAVDPSHEDGFLASVGGAQGAAHVSSSKIA